MGRYEVSERRMGHTPGPWVWTPSGEQMRDVYSQPFAIAQCGEANLVAGAFGDVRGGLTVAEANARLIAAAPELLEAARLGLQVIRHLNYMGGGSYEQKAIEAAILKTEGK